MSEWKTSALAALPTRVGPAGFGDSVEFSYAPDVIFAGTVLGTEAERQELRVIDHTRYALTQYVVPAGSVIAVNPPALHEAIRFAANVGLAVASTRAENRSLRVVRKPLATGTNVDPDIGDSTSQAEWVHLASAILERWVPRARVIFDGTVIDLPEAGS